MRCNSKEYQMIERYKKKAIKWRYQKVERQTNQTGDRK